jgi:predicted NBD/HSP70 family sugar kinase
VSSLAGIRQDAPGRNVSRLLKLVHVQGAMSRSELVAATGLTRSAVGGLTRSLAAAGLVVEQETSGSGVGRPSLLVAPVPRAVSVVAVDVGVSGTTAAQVGLSGDVLAVRHHRRRLEESSPAAVTAEVRGLVRQLTRSPGKDVPVVGVGVGVPGVVRHDDGMVRFAPNLGWHDVAFGQMLRDALQPHGPVVVGNDADLGALSEHLRGAAAGSRNCIYLSGEVGVGGGVIVDGHALIGAGGYAGEVGHMVIRPRGHLCRCGSRGCWETEIGREAILRAAGMPLDEQVETACARAHAGDPAARRGLLRVGRWLGIGLANLVNVFNPEVIVLGGELAGVYKCAGTTVDEELATALPGPRVQVQLRLPALEDQSTLIGAAEIAFTRLLDEPLLTLEAAPPLSRVSA